MINYLSLFSGIGAFESAMKNLNIPFNLVGFSEIDKYAVKSYCAMHDVSESLNYGDITKIDETKLPKVDFITYGFPCQDISLAGKQQGLFNDDGTKTRSGLFFDALRLIEATKPKVAIAENVKNLTSKKFAKQFKIVLDSLEEVGYNNYFKVLNAKDFGIPQNRERVFIISIRKDVDTGIFEFPEPYPLKLRLKDLLDETVDEKFYIDTTKIEKIMNSNFSQEKAMIQMGDVCGTLLAIDYKDPKCVVESNTDKVMQIGNCRPTKNRANPNQGRVYDTNGISPCLNTKGGGNLEPHVVESSIQMVDIPQTVKVRKYPVDCKVLCECLRNHKTLQNITNREIARILNVPLTKVEHWFRQDEYFAIPEPEIWMNLKKILKIETDEFDESIMNFEEKEGVYEKSERHYFTDGIAPTLTSGNAMNEKFIHDLRIRKLIPKECFRLMGFKDADFEKAEAVNSNTQLYKQAGNSIVVDVAEELLCMLFDEDGEFFI